MSWLRSRRSKPAIFDGGRLPGPTWRTRMRTTWAEDRAQVGTDPSADPGVASKARVAHGRPLLPRLQPQCPESWGLGQIPVAPLTQPKARRNQPTSTR